jgi:tRNA G46 methylase TrmB
MPDLVLNGGMIEMLTDPAVYRQALANYYAQQRAKRTYYETHKEEILAKKRQKYAAEHPEVKKKRKDPAE